MKFQEQVLTELGYPLLRATVRKPGRILNMVIREDSQGYQNWKSINKEVEQYLSTRCWGMEVYFPAADSFEKQVLAFARGDLSVSVHGAHMTNLIWQGQNTATIIIEKPGVSDGRYSGIAKQMGIAWYKAGPQSKIRRWDTAVENPFLNVPVTLNFSEDLKPVLERAIDDLERSVDRGPPCDVSKARRH